MKFRTEIEIEPYPFELNHSRCGLLIGSCFADNMSVRLASAKFNVECNPCGVMYNPASVASNLALLSSGRSIGPEDLMFGGGRYFSFDFHGSFSDADADRALEKMNAAVRRGAAALMRCDYAVITLGTAWVYEYGGRTVANCHKLPARDFSRRLLSVDDIVAALSAVLERELCGKDVIFTISPIRHLKDGFSGNSISKALLRVAVDEVVRRYDTAHYFPSFEIMNDDLRDYRFYASDMTHPSDDAVDYIWEKFSGAFFTEQTRRVILQVGKVVSACRHRPFDSGSEEYGKFCRRYLDEAEEICRRYPEVDMSEEIAYFSEFC